MNQQKKAEVVKKEVQESAGKHKMYRSMGRMFVLSSAEELTKNLDDDLKRIETESARSSEMKKNFEGKKEALTKVLNDMTPKQ